MDQSHAGCPLVGCVVSETEHLLEVVYAMFPATTKQDDSDRGWWVGIDKSASHQLSQIEIASDNHPVLDT